VPVVDIFVDSHKILHIKNHGRIDISDIQIFATTYTIKSHINSRNLLVLDPGIDSVSIPNGTVATKSFLRKGAPEYTIDLTKSPYSLFFHFVTEEEFLALSDEKKFKVNRTAYCLRILFRNELTKQRQVHYLVTGAIKDFPDFWDNRFSAFGGSYEGSLKFLRIRDLIKEHQANYYQDSPANFYKN